MFSNDAPSFARRISPFLGALLIAFLIYAAFGAYMYEIQRSMVFFPTHSYLTPVEAHADPALKEFPVKTADGLELNGWYAPATTKPLTLVFFHGNADDLKSTAPIAAIYIRAGYGILIAEYRGFSAMPGTPSETGLYADARAFMNALVASGVDKRNIVILGHSLGSGVATQMAAEFHVGGLILLAPFLSTVDVAKLQFWFLPVDLLMKDRFENFRKIGSISEPLLIANGGQDAVIPPSQGRALFVSAHEPKEFYFSPNGGHNDMFEHGFGTASLEWLDRLSSAVH
jgi:fermentation-respiration switch protein FrsA (DUF1100 family)